MGDPAFLCGLVHSVGELGLALGNRRVRLGRHVFALSEIPGAEVFGSEVRAVLIHDPQTVLQISHHLNGTGHATALDVGHFFLHPLTTGEVILPAVFRVLFPGGECRGNRDGESECTQQAQGRSDF